MAHPSIPATEVRTRLIRDCLGFVQTAQRISGVVRIALVGSVTSAKEVPKDVDVLVTVTDDSDLAPLAQAGRRLKGHTQSYNLGADIFSQTRRRATSAVSAIGRNVVLECAPAVTLGIAAAGLSCMMISIPYRFPTDSLLIRPSWYGLRCAVASASPTMSSAFSFPHSAYHSIPTTTMRPNLTVNRTRRFMLSDLRRASARRAGYLAR